VKQERAFALYLLVCHLYSGVLIWLVICIMFFFYLLICVFCRRPIVWPLLTFSKCQFFLQLQYILSAKASLPFRLTNKLADLEYSSCWKRNPSTIIKILRILWNPSVHYRVANSPPLVTIPSQIKPIFALAAPLFYIHSHVTFQCVPWSPKWYRIFKSTHTSHTCHMLLLTIRNAGWLSLSHNAVSVTQCTDYWRICNGE